MLLSILRVRGDSLSPDFVDGDFAVVVRGALGRYSAVRPGAVVVLRRPGYGTLIKRVVRVVGGGESVAVVGRHEQSIDSREFGPVPAGDIVGRVIWRIPRRPTASDT